MFIPEIKEKIPIELIVNRLILSDHYHRTIVTFGRAPKDLRKLRRVHQQSIVFHFSVLLSIRINPLCDSLVLGFYENGTFTVGKTITEVLAVIVFSVAFHK